MKNWENADDVEVIEYGKYMTTAKNKDIHWQIKNSVWEENTKFNQKCSLKMN